MTKEHIDKLEKIFDDFSQPQIAESDSKGDYMIVNVSNTGYNDNREHSLGDESLEEHARSKLENTETFSYVNIKLEHPNWLSDTVYVKLEQE